ncbi:hypothetical protein BDK51DRAFT_53222 [Blyttiomyces helicus]|uniref:Uncharacterized protein n=1 Tax=Blyttiomyces helicus TaxID=388810 RepID=A0A4P9WT76_9FUNG|nr:hypothetical protein BDK51DRAFT_53222 [Blyttiomyces helicus]|eukprot:RKO94256.1 hypothetical protein BDK51DRAFT_53222 [Blyttiomyces helicus]
MKWNVHEPAQTACDPERIMVIPRLCQRKLDDDLLVRARNEFALFLAQDAKRGRVRGFEHHAELLGRAVEDADGLTAMGVERRRGEVERARLNEELSCAMGRHLLGFPRDRREGFAVNEEIKRGRGWAEGRGVARNGSAVVKVERCQCGDSAPPLFDVWSSLDAAEKAYFPTSILGVGEGLQGRGIVEDGSRPRSREPKLVLTECSWAGNRHAGLFIKVNEFN